jgi:hypothetical protein
MSGDYQLVQLANGQKTLYSARYGEKMHPGLGPTLEAELLYVRQLKIRTRLPASRGEFVIWDVGLGAAANALATLRATRELAGELRLISFDNTAEPLQFALNNSEALGYVREYENQITALLRDRRVAFDNGRLKVRWEFHLGDFPSWLDSRSLASQGSAQLFQRAGSETGAPHAIFYDAFSPAKNPAMWTLPVCENLFRSLDPARPCALTTYTRSTMIRTTLLLAGFCVGVGRATGQKEETTMAANSLELITDPLDARWLERAARSGSAEPLPRPNYTQMPLSPATMERLRRHPQFLSAR